MEPTQLFLLVILIMFSAPFLIWRYFRTDTFAPLLIVQLLVGIALGPGVFGKHFPEAYKHIFSQGVTQSISGLSCWAGMLFVFIAGIELDLSQVWRNRRETGITVSFALGVPLLLGCAAGALLLRYPGWASSQVASWQFMLAIGMTCATTALPILLLILERLDLLRNSIGQRSLRYASLDDLIIWIVLAIVLMDWPRLGFQISFFFVYGFSAMAFRKLMKNISENDRWYFAFIWLAAMSFTADYCGLHFMEGAFLAGAVIDARWLDQKKMEYLRQDILMVMMPIFFLSSGLKANFGAGGIAVLAAAGLLLAVSIAGKLIGVHAAGRILRWGQSETSVIGWLLQTKGMTEIVFATVLLDKGVISGDSFAALLLLAVVSTMLTVPVVSSMLSKQAELVAKLT